jgi:hypothetical protein
MFWEWPDELEELGIDVESLDPIGPVDFDLNDLLGGHTDEPTDGLIVERGSGRSTPSIPTYCGALCGSASEMTPD